MEQGWDPEIKKFFRRIINTISVGLLWLLSGVTAGFYFGLAFARDKPLAAIIFYTVMLVTLVLLIRYYYRLWKK